MIVVELLGGNGCEVVEGLVGSFVVEPVDPVQGLDLDVVDVAPGSLAADEFGLERADCALGQGVDAPISVKRPRWPVENSRVVVASLPRVLGREVASGSG